MSIKNNRKRRARMIQSEDLYGLQPQSKKRWRQLLKILGDVCLKCGAKPITRDHIVPIARGGLNHPANLQPLCSPCNRRKGDNIADYRTSAQREAILARWPLEPVPIEKYTEPMRTTIADITGH